MESYRFRCVSDGCRLRCVPISGITISMVMNSGIPICSGCGNDLDLIVESLSREALIAQMHIRRIKWIKAQPNRPTAYGPAPGPPVNPGL